ncbi:hypothetical protein DFH27DRAFT_53545 [Peziza echinospora]|nr:hypothetical protein DFH27DRAFT_53545 [Peziza echinospora]
MASIQSTTVPMTFLLKTDRLKVEKPFELFLTNPPAGAPISNCEFIREPAVAITDVRDQELDLNLSIETTGFEFFRAPIDGLKVDVTDEASVLQYMSTMMAEVKDHLQADSVIAFDWRHRRGNPPNIEDVHRANLKRTITQDRKTALSPAGIVHCDESHAGGWHRLKLILTGDELQQFYAKKQRARLINIWRSIAPTVGDYPLAFCDLGTTEPGDFIACDKIQDTWIHEEAYFTYNERQKWYWLSNQTNEELSLFVTWDSKQNGPANGCPHGAFADPLTRPGDAPRLRESIEVRLLVITSDE